MKRNVLARRAASAALAACMMFSLSAPALAASTDALLQQSTAAKSAVSVLDMQNDISESATTMDLCNGSIIVSVENGQQYAEQNNIKQPISDLVVTTNNDETANTLTIKGGTTGAKVTLSNVNIDAPSAAVSVSGNVELVITGTNTLRSGTDRAGLEKADDNGTLTIDGTGKLYAYGGDCAAGIGSSYNNNVRNIVINGGTITAECTGMLGAGIGGGQAGKAENGKAENIRINGGVVTATGGEWGFGIGSGCYNDTSWLPTTITITGGTVKAIAKKSGAAIGALASANDLNMTGGSLTVQKFNDSRAWIISTTGSEMNRGSLTGAVTYQDGSGSVVGQNFGIEVDDQPVTSDNYQNLKGGRIVYDPEQKTLTAKERINNLLKIRAPKTDVILNGGIGARSSLTIGQQGDSSAVGAHDVTVTSDRYDAIQGEADINCTGKVDIRSSKSMAVDGSLNIYDSSEVTLSAGSSVVNGSANITSSGNVSIYSTIGRAAKELTINKDENVTISIRDSDRAVSEDTKITASGTVILKNKAQGGRVGTVAFTQADGKNYVYYTSEERDAELIDPRIHPLAEAAESNYLRIEPRETYSITVKNGTAQVGDDTTGLNTAFEGETITATAPEHDSSASFSKFEGWKLNKGSISEIVKENGEVVEISVKDGYIVDEHGEKIKEKIIRFKMPGEKVEMTAVYSVPAVVQDLPVMVTGGTINDTQDTLIRVKPGTKVTVKADAPTDEKASFHHWKVEMGTSADFGVTEGSLGSETEAGTEKISFNMPKGAVRLTAVYSIPDETPDPDAGYDASSAAGGAIAAVAVGGAAIWGGYEIATRVILNSLLPEGAAIPANRGQLALLVWNTAGRPEPAGAPAFADVADPDMAKAAQWCTEQGILDAKDDCFEPEGWTPKFKVIEVWNKAFPKQ